jgi:hypothetical protein
MRTPEDPKRIVLTSTAFIVLSAGLAKLFLYAFQAQPVKSALTAGICWISYLAIHKSETGKLIDPRYEEKHLPEDERNWIHLGVSAALFAAGMIYGSAGVSSGYFLQAFLGASAVILGYFIAHLEFSDHIV